MLNRSQIKYLRKYSHSLKPVFQIGKSGENYEQIKSIHEYLDVYEIVKISVLQNAPDDIKYYAEILAESGIEIVNTIGRTITVYKFSHNPNKKSEIRLP